MKNFLVFENSKKMLSTAFWFALWCSDMKQTCWHNIWFREAKKSFSLFYHSMVVLYKNWIEVFFKLWKTFETGFWHTSFSEDFGTFSKFSLILSISFLKIFLIYFISLLCHQFYLKSVSLLVHIVAWNCRSYSTLKKLVHMLTSHVYSIMK